MPSERGTRQRFFSLREAVRIALVQGGTEVFDQPNRLLSYLFDLCDSDSDEVRVLSRGLDDTAMEELRHGLDAKNASDLSVVAVRTTGYLVRTQIMQEEMSRSSVEQVCEGIADWLGIDYPAQSAGENVQLPLHLDSQSDRQTMVVSALPGAYPEGQGTGFTYDAPTSQSPVETSARPESQVYGEGAQAYSDHRQSAVGPSRRMKWPLVVLAAVLLMVSALLGSRFLFARGSGASDTAKSTESAPTESLEEPASDSSENTASYSTDAPNESGEAEASDANEEATAAESLSPIVAIAGGSAHVLGLRSDGTVVAAGHEEFGELGVDGWSDITEISAGICHSVALRSDGTVVGVGDNSMGKLDVSGWNHVRKVYAGGNHTVALLDDGTVVGAGSNGSGQLEIGSWADIIDVAAGVNHTVGLRSDGTVVAVGKNEYGQLNVDDWTDIVDVAAGYRFTVGLRADGTCVVAGRGELGSVADATGWTDVETIDAGLFHVVGLRSDHTVVAAGSDLSGQCEVEGWTDVEAIAAGGDSTVALCSDGSLLVASTSSPLDKVKSW